MGGFLSKYTMSSSPRPKLDRFDAELLPHCSMIVLGSLCVLESKCLVAKCDIMGSWGGKGGRSDSMS